MKAQHWLALVAALSIGTVLAASQATSQAASQEVTINLVDAEGEQRAVGTITIEETEYGLLFTPELSSLSPGVHGFHVHENGSCEAAEKEGEMTAAQAAGGHYDPEDTGKHLGPYADGHLGDLPALYVNADGVADYPVLAPRLEKLADIEGRALMIHSGGDNHADHPEPLGGGGSRLACGVIR